METTRRLVLLLQLPIPPPGPQPIHGNVPLAAAFLKLFAERQGLGEAYRIEILPPPLTNTLGDWGLVEAVLARRPWMVGFTSYVWNVERTLWIAQRLKEARPELRIVVGGPEVTPDNNGVLARSAVDYAIVGEGEQTFAELLAALHREPRPVRPIPGLVVPPDVGLPAGRRPLGDLDAVASPYVAGILGLPGDTVDSVRRGIDYLNRSRLFTSMQVFNLAILPGTAFRQEAGSLGLVYQSRPPYYVLQTPTLGLEDLYRLMEEAQEAFGLEFDPFPPPQLDRPEAENGLSCVWRVDLDVEPASAPAAERRAQAFTLWLRSADFDRRRHQAAALAERARLGPAWIDAVGHYATLAWSGGRLPEEELAGFEYLV